MTRETATEIEADAARWVIRVSDGLGASDQMLLDDWLDADTRRRGAYLQASAVAVALEDIDCPAKLEEQEAPSPKRPVPRRMMALACAASLAFCLMIASQFFHPATRYDTRLGEIRRIPLSDGSTAIINTQSLVSLDMTSDQRDVRLDKGEVWFQVAHDSRRPFIVSSGKVKVRAVGTAFSVRRMAGGTAVTVNEGVVEIWMDGRENRKRRVAAGDKALIENNRPDPIRILPADISRNLIWREGKIDLAGRTLQYAVAEFNRYNERKLVIADPRLASERFHGIFNVDEPAQFAIAVHDELEVPVQIAGQGDIVIGSLKAGNTAPSGASSAFSEN